MRQSESAAQPARAAQHVERAPPVQLHQLLTSVLFTVTSRHSSIENGALKYGYTPANPFSYRLKRPTDKADVTKRKKVAKKRRPTFRQKR